MKFTILAEDRTCDNNCISEHGLSIYMEIDNYKLLLDTGATDAFIQNAKLLNIDLNELDIIVLSHGHWDHGDGLKYLDVKKKLVLHPDCYTKRYSLKRNMEYAGINQNREELLEKYELIERKEPYEIFNEIWYLGQIDRRYDVDISNLPTVLEKKEIDYLYDDTGIVVKAGNGIIVIAGCSHSGICNIIEQAKVVAKDDRVIAVIGGFHLRELNESATDAIRYFKDNNIEKAYMGHCTCDEVIEEFEKQLKDITEVSKLYVGAIFEA